MYTLRLANYTDKAEQYHGFATIDEAKAFALTLDTTKRRYIVATDTPTRSLAEAYNIAHYVGHSVSYKPCKVSHIDGCKAFDNPKDAIAEFHKCETEAKLILAKAKAITIAALNKLDAELCSIGASYSEAATACDDWGLVQWQEVRAIVGGFEFSARLDD
jgi:hypothetical protein